MQQQSQSQQATNDRPPYQANWVPDATQSTEQLLDRHRRNAASPQAHEAYRRQLEEKTEKFGVIHVDPATGYRARFKVQAKPADKRKPADDSNDGE